MKTVAWLALAICVACGTAASGPQFSDGGFVVFNTSCANGLTSACAQELYGSVQAQIDQSTGLFAQGAVHGGFLTLEEADAGSWQLLNSQLDAQNAELGLLWVESLLFPSSANEANFGSVALLVNLVTKEEGRVEDELQNLVDVLGLPPGFLADGGAADRLYIAEGGIDGATAVLVSDQFRTSPVDRQFTPNYQVVAMAQALGVFWLYQSVEKNLPGPLANDVSVGVLAQFASQVSQTAADARARAATRCAEAPASPVCATVASYESDTIAPALDRLAAQMLVVADAGMSP